MLVALTIIHVIISIALVIVVLLQHGKQQGLSGAIAGGAETFFGKNKGRTIDAMLRKFTSVVAILFVISSIAFTAVAVNQFSETEVTDSDVATDLGTTEVGVDSEGAVVSLDEEGNLVDADGNVVLTAEQMAQQQAMAEEETPAE